MARVTTDIPNLTRFETRSTRDKNEIENIIKRVIQEQKTKKVPYFEYKELVRAFTVKQHELVNIDGKIFKTKNKNIARYNINITEDPKLDATKHKVLKLGEIRYFMKKYNIKDY